MRIILFFEIEFVEVGPTLTAAITVDGSLYYWGFFDGETYISPFDATKSLVEKSGKQISKLKRVSIGVEHIMILTVSEEVFCFGSNKNYQLGVENPSENFAKLMVIQKKKKMFSMAKKPNNKNYFRSISTQEFCSAAVTKKVFFSLELHFFHLICEQITREKFTCGEH